MFGVLGRDSDVIIERRFVPIVICTMFKPIVPRGITLTTTDKMSNFNKCTNQLYDILNDNKIAVTCVLTAGWINLYLSKKIEIIATCEKFSNNR